MHDSSLGRHINAMWYKSLEIQAYCITNEWPFQSDNLYKYEFLAAIKIVLLITPPASKVSSPFPPLIIVH